MSADTEPVHVCLGVDQCDVCRREDEFWRDYEFEEAKAQARETS